MSVRLYIKEMEMPESCSLCKLKTVVGLDKEKCLVSGVEFYSWDTGWGDEQRRHESCPLVPVPPHGRLIDADALINALQELFDKRAREAEFSGNRGTCVTWNDAIYHIKSAPTIIQAEEGA